MDPDWIFNFVLGFFWLENLWNIYLSHRQRKVLKSNLSPPRELSEIMDGTTFEKARTYALDKSGFDSFRRIYSGIFITLIVCGSGYKVIWDLSSAGAWSSILFHEIVFLIQTLVGLPLEIYEIFVIEEKHGFNKQTFGFWVKDQIKKLIVSQAFMVPLIVAIIKIIEIGGDYFHVYLWVFTLLFTLFMMIIYPEFIAPLFDKYVPLPDGDLKRNIEELAASISFPLYKLFVVEGSKRSSHSNAYFYGFFNFKRIVLFDTLLEESERKKVKEAIENNDHVPEEKVDKDMDKGCNNEEILAVLAHELGHWKLNHVLKNIIVMEVQMFVMFVIFKLMYEEQSLYSAFGFIDERPILVGLMIIFQFILAPLNTVLSFLMTMYSRHFEFQADEFAVSLGKADKLISALVKLTKDNLGFPIYDNLYSAWHHSHPPLLERINAIKDKKRD